MATRCADAMLSEGLTLRFRDQQIAGIFPFRVERMMVCGRVAKRTKGKKDRKGYQSWEERKRNCKENSSGKRSRLVCIVVELS
jgi:hypothetical protein